MCGHRQRRTPLQRAARAIACADQAQGRARAPRTWQRCHGSALLSQTPKPRSRTLKLCRSMVRATCEGNVGRAAGVEAASRSSWPRRLPMVRVVRDEVDLACLHVHTPVCLHVCDPVQEQRRGACAVQEQRREAYAAPCLRARVCMSCCRRRRPPSCWRRGPECGSRCWGSTRGSLSCLLQTPYASVLLEERSSKWALMLGKRRAFLFILRASRVTGRRLACRDRAPEPTTRARAQSEASGWWRRRRGCPPEGGREHPGS